MSNPFKLSREQQDEVAYVVACRKGWRYPVPIKVLAHRYGVGMTTMTRYVQRADGHKPRTGARRTAPRLDVG